MRIGLIDVDGHHFPNLALMRISSWHKSQGDVVEWWWSDFVHYDIVYMSKVFSNAYSNDVPEPMNADKVIRGGQGTQSALVATGRNTLTRMPMQTYRLRLSGASRTIPSIRSLTSPFP